VGRTECASALCGPHLSLPCGHRPAHSLRHPIPYRAGRTNPLRPIRHVDSGRVGEISSSFEFYEGLRALVPGAFVVALYAAICKTFGLADAVSVDATLAGLLATLAAGFVLLFLDLPSRAAVSHYNTPIAHVAAWSDVRRRADASAKNIYYEILDVEVPPGIKTKVHYFTALYKIGFELIYVAAASIPVLGVVAVLPSTSVARFGTIGNMRAALLVAVALHLVIAALALISRRGKIQSDFSVEWPLADLLLIVAGIAGLAVYLAHAWRPAGVVAVMIAASIYGVAAISVCAVSLHAVGHAKSLNATLIVGWQAASLAAAALIAARDHEKKLLGVYATQRTWLDGARDRLIDKGYFVPVPPPSVGGTTAGQD
jgi:hypothetical protein